MIRPISIVTFLMACGSGLYLYQSKHEVQLLDRTIEKTVHDTNAMREQSRLLATEWNMLNDPERLRQFSDTYLSVKSINPAQYTSLNDLGGRLPAPRIEAPAPAPIEPLLGAQVVGDNAPPAVADPEAAVVAEQDMLPVPPIPIVAPNPTASPSLAVRPVQLTTPVARPVEARSLEAKVALVRPAPVADVKPSETRPAEMRPMEPKPAPRMAELRPEVRTQSALAPRPIVLAAPRPQPVYSPPASVAVSAPGPSQAPAPVRQVMPASPAPASASAPYSGSLLGMARGPMPPAPRPLPVTATYNAN
jgi:hypothetical protein